ncbi:MAG: extracellular solute-binding protein [Acidimicrobiales bacterium]
MSEFRGMGQASATGHAGAARLSRVARMSKAGVALVAAGVIAAACSSAPKAKPSAHPSTGPVTITMSADGIIGGKNASEATWLTKDVIPAFEKMEAAKGRKVTVNFQGTGVSGTDFATQLALDLKSGGGPDVFDLDGPYYGEFVEAGYLKPLSKVVGPSYASWSGWAQIPKSVQSITEFRGVRYGIPTGTDARVLYYNKKLFAEAGLPTKWQPKSWADIISAAQTIKAKDPGVTPLQIDAGTEMAEATTLQGFLPMLAGTGTLIYSSSTNKWQGNTPQVRQVLDFYHQIYSTGLANPTLQIGAHARSHTFELFSQGKIAIYSESIYLYDSVIAPTPTALFPMADRDSTIGYALIPAEKPGTGIRGQSFVSMSGGGGQTINPYTKHPRTAWAFLTFMNSKAELLKEEGIKSFLSARRDVNAVALKGHPQLTFVATKVLPLTAYRPSLAIYPQVSLQIQAMVQSVAEGTATPAAAAKQFSSAVAGLVGPSHVVNS